jgi:hypothetical protein
MAQVGTNVSSKIGVARDTAESASRLQDKRLSNLQARTPFCVLPNAWCPVLGFEAWQS